MRTTSKRFIALASAVLLLTACETPTTQRYSIAADNNQAIKSLNATGVGISNFQPPSQFDASCRAVGALKVADGLTHSQYIQKAFEDELKVAGSYSTQPARVTISGRIQKLEFSSTRAITGGSWSIDLLLISSNRSSLSVSEYYEFDSGFSAFEACRQTADAFSRAVQNLVGKAVKNPAFVDLVK